jgi:hypothetical protein
MGLTGSAPGVLQIVDGRLSYIVHGRGALTGAQLKELERRTGRSGLAEELADGAVVTLFDVPLEAVGADVPVSIVLMGYLIGQLGGLLPLPGGVGGIDGGLIGTLIVYGAPAAATVAAVLAYRIILFWLPLVGGAIAFAMLRRALDRADRPDLCVPIPAT